MTRRGFLSTVHLSVLLFPSSFIPHFRFHRQPTAESAPVSIVTLSPTPAPHNQVNGMGVGAEGEQKREKM